MRRGFRAAVWTLLLLAVLAVAVIVPIGALQAHGAADFSHWVGLATIAAVPLATCGVALMFWDKIAASVGRLTTGNRSEPLRQRLDHDQPQAPAEGEDSHGESELRPSGRPGDTLPMRNPNFTGRAEQLDELESLLAAGPVAVVAVRGLGGVGKSQLALEYAHRMRESGRYQLAGWVRADSSVTMAEDLAALAPLLGLPEEAAVGEIAARAIVALGSRREWLLVFDNAQAPDDVARMVPHGDGHILITSRNRQWSGIATQLNLGLFNRAESVKFVIERSGSDEPGAASELARELDDLPLALAQAAAYIDTHSTSISRYLESYRDRGQAQSLLDVGLSFTEYPASVARTWLISFDQLSDEKPAAVDLLRLCAFLDSDDIDLDVLSKGSAGAVSVLATLLSAEERMEAAGALAARSLVTISAHGHLRVHRLVQAVTRDQLGADQYAEWAKRVLNLIAAVLPSEPWDYRRWPDFASVAPHIEAVAAHASNSAFRTEKIDLLKKLGIYLVESEQLWAARLTFQRILALQEEIWGPDDPEVAKALDNLGAAQSKLGELREARSIVERALAVFTRAYGPRHLEVAKALGNLSIIQRDLWQLREARTSIERALRIFQEVYGPDHRDLTHTFVNLGIIQLRQGELAEARGNLERALAISEAADRPDHPEAVSALIGLGSVQMRQRELQNARDSMERALVISERLYGRDNPEVSTALINLGAVQTRQGELDQARVSLERALRKLHEAYGHDHPEVASALVYLGAVQLELGELEEASAGIERALAIREKVYDHAHPWLASTLINLGVVQLRQGRLEEARANLERALAISRTAFGPNHPEVASALVPLGVVHLRQGRLEAARENLQHALEISETVYGPSHPEVARGAISLVVVHMRMRRLRDARDSLKHARKVSEAAFGFDRHQVTKTVIDLGVIKDKKAVTCLVFAFMSLARAERIRGRRKGR